MTRAKTASRGAYASTFAGFALAVAWLLALNSGVYAENWPRWRGPSGNAVSGESPLPHSWSRDVGIAWKTAVPGNGFSSPIVWGDRVWVTSSLAGGEQRAVHAIDRTNGRILWTKTISDDFPEQTSAMTGHAASTPVTDGRRVVAFFGNAGAVCYDLRGRRLWHRKFGYFQSELGLASSPILVDDRVVLLGDHDGDRFNSFDSFLIALDADSGETVWKSDRRGLFRSWSTPIVVPDAGGGRELVVNAQDELRAYDLAEGRLRWQVRGMTGWVTPSPVFGHDLIFATSGRDGPIMAVRLGGSGDVTETHVAWSVNRGAPYVCSPVLYEGRLYVHNEQGVLTCLEAISGKLLYRRRLEGKFYGSSVAGDGKIYLTNDAGTTYVVQAGDDFRLLATNKLADYCITSPAISGGDLFLRTKDFLWCIAGGD